MTLVLVVIALELAALLYVAWRTYQLLEKKIWNNTAKIDGNMMDATRALIDSEKWLHDVRDTIIPIPRDQLDHTTDDLRELARRIKKMPEGTLSDEKFARLTVDALNKRVKNNDPD